MTTPYVPVHGKELSKEEIKALIEKHDVKFVRLQFVDINGQAKNMAIPANQIDKILNNELMLDGSSIKGFRSIETSDMMVSVVLALSMSGIVLMGCLIGMSLPFILHRLKLDPASASAPLVTSICDATGVVVYLFIASQLLL